MGTRNDRSVLFVTTADSKLTPHAEWIPWALERAGWEVTAVTPAGSSSLLRNVLKTRWDCRELPCDRSMRAEFTLLKELLKARFGRANVIYLHSQGLGWRAALVFLGPLFGKRLVYHNPDYYDPIAYPVRSALEKLLARCCDLVISHEYHRGYIMRAHCRLRCPVLISPPNLSAQWPIPAPSLEKRLEMSGGVEKEFILRLHSGFSPRRMVPQLFEALALLPSRFRLVMNGGHARPEVEPLLKSLGISDRVVMLPPLDYGKMLEYTVNSDAGVLLYSNNDLGNFFQSPGRLTEYLACGVPVIAPRFTGIENVVYRYGIGRCVNAADPRALAAGIFAIEDDVRTSRLSPSVIRSRFEAHFAFEHWESRVAEAFDSLLAPRRRTAQAPPPEYWFPEPVHE
jgi:glycosyltransferase involved in cell wall biosynthesis